MTAPQLVWRCDECEAVYLDCDLDRVPDPQQGSTRVWTVCPGCRAAEQFTNLCDEPGCLRQASCGWPSISGYRRTCGVHWGVRGT